MANSTTSTGDRPPIKMIATDIDGTMLGSDGKLAPEVKQSLHRAREAGIYVVPTTGRPKMVALDVIEALDMNDYWIFANGALTWHEGRQEIVSAHWMEQDAARDVVQLLTEGLPNCGLAVEFEDSVAYHSGFEDLVFLKPDIEPVDDILAAITEPVQKVLVFDSTISVDELFDRTVAIVGTKAVPTHSGLPFIELAGGEVTKATAVAELAQQLGINQAEVASFGDNHNDVSMLEWAGRGYAMGNAEPSAVEAADEQILSNDLHGLARQVDALVAEWESR